MRVLLWHVHGSWTTSFVQGDHQYIVPVNERRDADGVGLARTYRWPDVAREMSMDDVRAADIDVVVLQRPHEAELVGRATGRRPGLDLPAVYVEHNTPAGPAVTTAHPMSGQQTIPIVHITRFNELVWDNGVAPTMVIENGIIDPGHRYTGAVPHAAVVVNEPVRRGRAVGTDLLPLFTRIAPVDVFGADADLVNGALGLPADRLRPHVGLRDQRAMHELLLTRRVFVHPHRWTSLAMSLGEAMLLGLPVVALACTEVPSVVAPEAGCVSTDPQELAAAVGRFIRDPHASRAAGAVAREIARDRFDLRRFLADWDRALATVAHDRI